MHRVLFQIVVEPGVEVLGCAFVGHQIGAVWRARRVAECRLRNGKRARRHGLLGDFGAGEAGNSRRELMAPRCPPRASAVSRSGSAAK